MSGPQRRPEVPRACIACGIVQAFDLFPIRAYRPDGSPMYDCRCRACRAKMRTEQRRQRATERPAPVSPWSPDPVVAELNRIFAEWRAPFGHRRLVASVGVRL